MSNTQPITLANVDSNNGMVSWHCTQENIWCADDGQSFVVREDDGWYAYMDDGNDRRRGPFRSAKLAMSYAS